MKSYRVSVDPKLCKGCGICVEICPSKALKLSETPNEYGYHNPIQIDRCLGCRLCENYCPDFAITIIESSES